MIAVTKYEIHPEDPSPCVGRSGWSGPPEAPMFKATLALSLDAQGLADFLAAMDQVNPGFRERYAPWHAHALPVGAPALPLVEHPAMPPAPLEAEFEDP